MLILGIESSCDETAAAVVADGTRILSDVVVSQVDIHREYGGVVPELASRKHIEAVSVVIEQALLRARVRADRLEGIGVTRGPGLIGSLLVGISAAKGIALALNLPLCGVNHLHGHLFAAFLERSDLAYPFMGLVVSGGHTTLFKVAGPLDITVVGRTRDDAAGEAFDKVAKLLGLGYPGGPAIEQAALGKVVGQAFQPVTAADWKVRPTGPPHGRQGAGKLVPDTDPGPAPQTIGGGPKFPRALMDRDTLDFSFSGLKTAVLRHVEAKFGRASRKDLPGSFHPFTPPEMTPEVAAEVRIVAAAFQEAVVDVLVAKAFRAAQQHGCDRLVVCGGVAANSALRQGCMEAGKRMGIEPLFT